MSARKLVVFVIAPLSYWVHLATTKWAAQLDDGIAHTFVSTAMSSSLKCRILDTRCRRQGAVMPPESPPSLRSLPFEREECRLEVTTSRDAESMVHPVVSARSLYRTLSERAFLDMKTVHNLPIKPAHIEPRIGLSLLTGMQEGEDGHLMTIARHRFGRGIFAARTRREKPVKAALRPSCTHGLVFGNEPFRGREIFGGPSVQVSADAKAALHRGKKSIFKRGGAAIHPVWRIRHPCNHHARGIGG